MFNSHPSARRRRAAIITALALTGILIPTTAEAKPSRVSCERRNNNSYDKLLECVRLEGVRKHQEALQEIADANGGNRADQTPGYTASVDYVVETMERAGWEVERVPFQYDIIVGEIEQLTPVMATYESGGFTGSALGTIEGDVIPVDINLTPPRASTSGCEAADFAALDFSGASDIALIQRGTCFFADKVANAVAAGAEGVIIFNQGNTPDREPLFIGDAGGPWDIVVAGASFADATALAQPGSTARITVEAVPQFSENVIAELPGRNDDNVVMAGAHLDSVPAGPGINDNGSGSAALLEVAEQLGNIRQENTLRFAWWGAEELGLIGSAAWVDSLSAAELERIALYLNFDMVGSPNYVFQVYDADESTFPAPVPIPAGSVAIEDVFESFYTYAGEPYDDSEFSGRSDYEAFILNGIPSSGLFTGAEQIKTPEQEMIWGGIAGEQFDQCYHAACDTYANNSDHALDVNADAVGFAVLTFAYSTESVNGVPGRKVPGKFVIPAPAGPEGTFETPAGGLAPAPAAE